MRPTDLHFRSPKQKTPEFYEQRITKEGKTLNFQSVSKNKKRTFPSQERFPQYNDWSKVTGQFLGPGTYNEALSFKVQRGIPCSIVYKNHSIGKEAGRPSFIMIGNNMTYEPSFENTQVKKQLSKVSIDQKCGVPSVSAFGRTSISQLRKAQTKMMNITTLSNTSFINRKSIEQQNLPTNESIQEVNMNRPQSSYQVVRPMSQNTLNYTEVNIKPGYSQMSQNQLIALQQKQESPDQNSAFNPKASISTKTSSTYNQRFLSSQNKQRTNQISQSMMEETAQSQNMEESNLGQSPNDLSRPYSEMNPNGRQKVFYAKTAQNFYNLAKGYWRPGQRNRKQKLERQIQKQINILSAYGEYDNFKTYQQQLKQSKPKSVNASSLAIQQA